MRTNNALLRSIAPEDYEKLQRNLEPVGRSSGQVLYEPDDKVDWVYFPEAGLVSLLSVMLSGDQVETAVVGREGGIGFLEATGVGVIFSRAIVQVDLVAQRAPASAYLAVFDASPSFRRTVASHVELTIAEGRQTIACIAHHSAQERLAWWLLECEERTGLDEFRLTQEFLSAMLAVARSTVSTLAAVLKDEGLIDYSRGLIKIVDHDGLVRKSCECHATNQRFRALIEGPQRFDARSGTAI